MVSSDSHVVVVDFPGIKQFVFGTDRLVEIRGASALLDRLNRDLVPARILERFGASRSQCVFAGGGAGQFILQATPQIIREVFHEIQGEVYRQSGGALRTTIGIGPLKADYQTALARAFLDLERGKREHPFTPSSTVHTGFIRECDSCSGMATELTEFAGETRVLCRSCAQKEKTGREHGLWDKLSGYLEGHGTALDESRNRRPKDFEEIGDRCETRRGYTALVYGDGNAMGRIVKQIREAAQFGRFSQAVDNAVQEACYEAFRLHCRPVKGKIPADILLLGGDDLMVYLAADCAMSFAVTVARLFEEKTRTSLLRDDDDSFFKDRLGDKGLTLSIGIAYGKSHTPISIMADQAEELLKSAKKKGASQAGRGAYTPACIDFHPTIRFNQARVKDSRDQRLEFTTPRNEKVKLYRGPYTLEEAEALIKHATHLIRSGIPRTRLHRLGEAPFEGKLNGTIQTLTLYGRCRTSEQKQAIWNALDRFGGLPVMPWNTEGQEISTALVDLIMIAEFIKQKEEDAEHAPSY